MKRAAALLWALGGVLIAPAGHAAQPNYPAKPIRMVVAQSAGGNADFVARYYAQRLTEQLGQQSVIANRAGGSGAPNSWRTRRLTATRC